VYLNLANNAFNGDLGQLPPQLRVLNVSNCALDGRISGQLAADDCSITLHYITLHYITLHYITLHYITLHHITLHYNTLHYITCSTQKKSENPIQEPTRGS
jgi:hypothetical protein